MKGLHAWIHNLPPPRLSRKTNKVHVLVKVAMEEQDIIGWDNILRGRLSLNWGKAQTAHLFQQQSTVHSTPRQGKPTQPSTSPDHHKPSLLRQENLYRRGIRTHGTTHGYPKAPPFKRHRTQKYRLTPIPGRRRLCKMDATSFRIHAQQPLMIDLSSINRPASQTSSGGQQHSAMRKQVPHRKVVLPRTGPPAAGSSRAEPPSARTPSSAEFHHSPPGYPPSSAGNIKCSSNAQLHKTIILLTAPPL